MDKTSRAPFEIDILAFARIVLAGVVWSEYASYFLPYRDLSGYHLFTGLVFYATSLALMLGWRARASAFLLGLLLLWLKIYDGQVLHAPHFTHHYETLLALLVCLMGFTPCQLYFSFDRALGKRTVDSDQTWFLPMFRGLLSSVYLFAAIAKTSYGSVTGVRLYMTLADGYFSSMLPPFDLSWPMLVLSWQVILIELFFSFAIWNKNLARRSFPLAIGFHALLFITLPVATFSLLMILGWSIIVFLQSPTPLTIAYRGKIFE